MNNEKLRIDSLMEQLEQKEQMINVLLLLLKSNGINIQESSIPDISEKLLESLGERAEIIASLSEKEVKHLKHLRDVASGKIKLRRKDEITKDKVISALEQCNGNKIEAAAKLGCSLNTIYSRLKED